VSRPAVSQHLKVLADTGLVTVRHEGTRHIYAPDPTGLETLRDWVDRQWTSVLDHFERAARRKATMMSPDTRIEPIVKTRRVPLPPEQAFELFTERIGEWWPTVTHSIAGDDVVGVRFDGRVGGRVVEVTRDGTQYSWADVLAWDPPHRFVLSWHPNPAPVAASRLEVRFVGVDGGTEIMLRHDGWEEFGERAADLRTNYDRGWEVVLRPLESAARRTASRTG
jgi:uncharacterized protein YndB with AHSA1/START domain